MARDHRGVVVRKIRLSVAILAVAAAVTLMSSAQDNLGRGRIAGQVVDGAGAPIVEAKVVAESLQSHVKLDALTDKKGHFAIGGLGSGTWRITASKVGYVSAASAVTVAQLKSSPPIILTLPKASAAQGLPTDKVGLSLIDRGNVLLDQGDSDGALALYKEFQGKYPGVYQIGLNLAAAYLKKGDPASAEAEFKRTLEAVIKVRGDFKHDKATAIRALSGLGELAVRKGDMTAAQKDFSDALAVSPEDEGAAYNVGEMLFSNQQPDEAIKYFELAIRLKKDWPKPYYRLGFVYLNKGDYAKSLESFNKFVALDPENPETPNVKNMIIAIEKMKK